MGTQSQSQYLAKAKGTDIEGEAKAATPVEQDVSPLDRTVNHRTSKDPTYQPRARIVSGS